MGDRAGSTSTRSPGWSVSFALLAVPLLGACAEPNTAPPEPEPPGNLHVHVTTVGSVIDADGYWFRARDTTDFLRPNDDFTVSGMDPGPIEVELGNVASNCALTGENILQLDIRPDATTTAEYSVRCEAPDVLLVGFLQINGPEPDPDGVTVSIDGEPAFDLRFDGDDRGAYLRPGRYELEVDGVSSNCAVEGPNPRSVYLEMGTSRLSPVVYESITLNCVDAPGALEVSVSTSGRSGDPDGYDISLDGVPEAQFGPNQSVLLEGVASDSVLVRLTGVAANCGVLGGVSRTVRVPALDTLRIGFEVVCGAGFALRYENGTQATLDGPAPELGPEWTVEMWARVEAGSALTYTRLLQQDDVIFIEAVPNDDGSYRFGAAVTFQDGWQIGVGACSVPAGEWNHHAVTYTAGRGRMYANGVLCNAWTHAADAATAPANPLMAGGPVPFSSNPAPVLVDELRIWSEARTEDELRSTWSETPDPAASNLEAYWRFDEGAGQLARDETSRFGDFVLGDTTGSDAADPSWIAPGRP